MKQNGGSVRLMRSHIDQGWLTKWGRIENHINFFTCGYIAAMFAVADGRPPGSFSVRELESIVSGSPNSSFVVNRK